MKKTIINLSQLASCLFLMLLIITTSCNQASLIETDVIDPDRADIVFIDSLSIFASSVEEDSVRTFNSLNLLSSYLCGDMDDPILGKAKAIINTQLRLTGTLEDSVFIGIPTMDTQLDSVIFVLMYDTARFYGELNTLQNISVSLLTEDMDNNETYFSDKEFATEPQPLVTTSINPSEFDTTFTIISGIDTIRPPLMRIALDKNLPIFKDVLFTENSSQYYESDTSFLDVFKGIQIASTPVNPGTADGRTIMGFNLASSLSGLYLYYQDDTTGTKTYRFGVNNNAAQMVNFQHDYTGSEVEPFIENEINGDSLVFIQGMSGLNAKLRIPYAQNLENVIVNQAQLEFTVATILPNDDPVFHNDPVPQLLISKLNDDGELTIISDLEAAINVQDITGVFGGNLTNVSKNNIVLRKYTMNISDHLQDMIDGVETSDAIFITALAKAQNAQRSILFGPGHSTYPLKLNITYTINQ